MANRWMLRVAVLLVTLVSLAAWVGQVSAAPAAPTEFELTQPDGSTFTARQWGDEWQNGYETECRLYHIDETERLVGVRCRSRRRQPGSAAAGW